MKEIDCQRLKEIYRARGSKVEIFDQIAEDLKNSSGAQYFLEKTPEHCLFPDSLLNWYPN